MMFKRIEHHQRHKMLGKISLFSALTIGLLAATPGAAFDRGLAKKMVEGRISITPFGFKKFCETERRHCDIFRNASGSELVRMNALRYDELSKVNASVNAEIYPVPEIGLFSSDDDWKLPTNSGDCEDFVLLKQARLIEMGWPESALLITVVDMKDGTRHAVLTVRTDSGDLILDNLTNRVLDWQKVDYRWIKRQSARNMMRWVEIKEGETKLSLSINTRSTLMQGLII